MIQMALIRKLIKVGGSRAVTIPATWIQYHEKMNTQKIQKIGMEIDGKIVIWPILKEWE
jgi:antitoxin component of MazEF toxin-antitoxin module